MATVAGTELADLLELEAWIELELSVELEIWLELDCLLELIALELRLELLDNRLLLKLLLESVGLEELLKVGATLLEGTDEERTEEEIAALELELGVTEDEETAPSEELEGILAPAWLLEIVAMLDCTELATELTIEDLTEEAWLTGGVVPPPPPPQAVKATLSDTAETIRKE